MELVRVKHMDTNSNKLKLRVPKCYLKCCQSPCSRIKLFLEKKVLKLNFTARFATTLNNVFKLSFLPKSENPQKLYLHLGVSKQWLYTYEAANMAVIFQIF